MKLPFVSRKTYDMLKDNMKVINQHKIDAEDWNKKLQKQVIDYEYALTNAKKEIKTLKTKLTKATKKLEKMEE